MNNNIRLFLWLIVGVVLTWVMLPFIGFGLLLIFGLIAAAMIVSIIVNLFTGRGGVKFYSFNVNKTPTQKAAAVKEEQDESFDAQYGEDAGEVVELPPEALHKEGQ